MIDKQGRTVDYLRLSVTDKCNLRCTYCMPEEGIESLSHKEILRVEEIEELVKVAANLGIKKVRITGGEPLVRRGIEDIVARIGQVPGITDIGITTNAILLPEKADALKAAGVKRVNISLDTLDPDKYTQITRGGSLADALKGIEVAREKGFSPIKINTVLMGGINDDEILDFIEFGEKHGVDVRFIEIMPIGECADWNAERFISADKVLEVVPELEYIGENGVAREYRKPGKENTVGLISPISSHFCPDCNKIRITSDGRLKPCLHSSDEMLLKGKSGEELSEEILKGIYEKPMKHKLETEKSSSKRNMNSIGG